MQRFRNQGLGPHRTPLKASEKFLCAWATQQPHCYTTNVGNIIQDDSFSSVLSDMTTRHLMDGIFHKLFTSPYMNYQYIHYL